jgi:hypothetical protein
VARRAAVLLLVGLLLVPLAVSGHRFAQHDVHDRGCAACVVAHQASLVAPSTMSTAPVVARGPAAHAPCLAVVARAERSPQAGRAPPSLLHA